MANEAHFGRARALAIIETDNAVYVWWWPRADTVDLSTVFEDVTWFEWDPPPPKYQLLIDGIAKGVAAQDIETALKFASEHWSDPPDPLLPKALEGST